MKLTETNGPLVWAARSRLNFSWGKKNPARFEKSLPNSPFLMLLTKSTAQRIHSNRDHAPPRWVGRNRGKATVRPAQTGAGPLTSDGVKGSVGAGPSNAPRDPRLVPPISNVTAGGSGRWRCHLP